MADITQTPADVEIGSAVGSIVNLVAGAAIVAGDQVYRDAADSNQVKPAITTSEATANVYGMAITSASEDGQVAVLQYRSGLIIDPGGTVTLGEIYGVSANGGKFAPTSDWTTDDFMTVVGVGISSTQIRVTVNATGIQHT